MDKPFWCYTCNKEITEVDVDGYAFGDRMLEGVIYRVKNDNGEPKLLGIISMDGNIIDPKDDAYMHQLNYEMWNERCIEHCKELDIASCPHCKDQVLVWSN